MIVVLFASNLLASLSQSLMNVALDDVANTFHITLSLANWMVLGYTIVTATVIMMAAALLKRLGLRKVMMLGFAFSLIGSLLGFIAWNYPVMIVARLLQAVCTGICFPLINEALLTISPKGHAGVLLAVNSGIIGAGLAFAPPVAGLIVTYIGLHELFLVPAVMALALFVAGHFTIHDLYQRKPGHIDISSVILSFIALAGILYGLNELSHELVSSLIIMILGLVVFALFIWRQTRLKQPLLNLKPLRAPVFAVGELLVALSYMASVYMSLLVPLYLEGAAGCTTFMAGCMCVLPILCYAICCFPSGKILGKHGVWPLVPAGFAIVLIGYIGMYFTSAHVIVIGLLVCAALAYAGLGIFFPSVKSVDLEVLPNEVSSDGSSIHSTIVQFGSSISSALFVGIMSGDVTRLMASGASKASAYASGFSHTIVIEIGILVAAVIIAVIYTRLVKKFEEKSSKDSKSES